MPAGPLRLVSAAPNHRPLAIRVGKLEFKKAVTEGEIEQVHRLNYETFVREIGQYDDAGGARLVDKFDDKNLYLIAKRGPSVVGMIAVHDRTPFSVAGRMRDAGWIERNCRWPLEVRLLAIRTEERNRTVLYGLLWSLYRLALAAGYSHLLMSGVRQQLRMYQRLGFESLGPEVAAGRAWFTPMCLDMRRGAAGLRRMAAKFERHAGLGPFARRPGAISLLPGPAQLSRDVRRALARRPVSHRDPRFVERYERVRATLRGMTGASDVGLLVGSGTLANECVGATLATRFSRRTGVVLVNGEFGRRLVDLALRWRLRFRTLEWSWGEPWNLTDVDAALARAGRGVWVWGVHCETSTGLLNDIAALTEIAAAREAAVCADCISSLGSVALDLSRVFLATGVSGKCLGAAAGIAMVFGNAEAIEACARRAPSAETRRGASTHAAPRDVPTYLDTVATLRTVGPRFTFPAALLAALDVALREYRSPARCAATYLGYAELGRDVRRELATIGATPLAAEACAAPAVTTFLPPLGYAPEHFALLCRSYGYEINALSPYLAPRGLVQIATMGAVQPDDCRRLFRLLRRWAKKAG